MIYFSYYANWRNYPEGSRKISISRNIAGYIADSIDERGLELAPTQGLLDLHHSGNSWKEYENQYWKETLSKLDVHRIAAKYENNVLLCYETPDENCHRQIVKRWFEYNGYECQEVLRTFEKKQEIDNEPETSWLGTQETFKF